MLEGIYVASVTPFRDDADRTVDVAAYRQHVAWLESKGVNGVVAFGTNGEGPSVASAEKAALLEALVADDPGIGIVPALTEGNLPDTLALLRRVNDLPVEGVLVLPPYYFRPVDAEGLRPFFERVLEVAQVPVLAYHFPRYSAAVPLELVTSMPFWGVKNSAGDLDYSAGVRAAGRQVMLGTEADLAGQLPDAQGAISALANIAPELMVEVHDRVRAGDEEAARLVSDRLSELQPLVSPGILKAVAQSRSGVPMGTVRAPLTPVPVDTRVRELARQLEVPVG
jgi:4-hydroxy-tetrahydrodipicolinate synthase